MKRSIKSAACIFFSLLIQLHAQEFPLDQFQQVGSTSEESMIVNAGEAHYDGNEIILIGHVDIEHSLGKITAHRLILCPERSVHLDSITTPGLNNRNMDIILTRLRSLAVQSGHFLLDGVQGLTPAKKMKFAYLKISEGVQIELHEGGHLSCQQAELDYEKMEGIFIGNAAAPDVIYRYPGESKEGSSASGPPLEVKCHKMVLQLSQPPRSLSSHCIIKQIEATQNVRISYQDNLLRADRATFHPKGISSGMIALSAKESFPFCEMSNQKGDRLTAKAIQINTAERKISFQQPKGKLQLTHEKFPSQGLEFKAKEMIWDEPKQILTLREDVEICSSRDETLNLGRAKAPGLNDRNIVQPRELANGSNSKFHPDWSITHDPNFCFSTDHEMTMMQKVVGGKRKIISIYSPRRTQMTFLEEGGKKTYRIYCPGPLFIDHEKQEMILQGLVEGKGLEERKRQVYMENMLGEMYADRVELNYHLDEKLPDKIILKGEVRLLNHFDGHIEESGSVLNYALADRVEYSPLKQELDLMSFDGHRVLVFDKVNNVQMSAPSLSIFNDVKTHKGTIQGHGDVRFKFIEKELTKFKDRFRLENLQESLLNEQSK